MLPTLLGHLHHTLHIAVAIHPLQLQQYIPGSGQVRPRGTIQCSSMGFGRLGIANTRRYSGQQGDLGYGARLGPMRLGITLLSLTQQARLRLVSQLLFMNAHLAAQS